MLLHTHTHTHTHTRPLCLRASLSSFQVIPLIVFRCKPPIRFPHRSRFPIRSTNLSSALSLCFFFFKFLSQKTHEQRRVSSDLSLTDVCCLLMETCSAIGRRLTGSVKKIVTLQFDG